MSNLERALREMRNRPVPPEQVQQAASRVLANLTAEHNKVVMLHPAADRIQGCADFQSLIPGYLSGSLNPSRKLLFEDHVRECVGCRQALRDARNPLTSRPSVRKIRGHHTHRLRWAALAAAVLLIVGAIERDAIRDFVFPIEVHAVAKAVNGSLYRVSGQDIRAVKAGERIERHEAVRTGTDSGAVLQLPDGSRIEMNARAELSLDRAGDGVRIRLARGNVIVTAAKQKQGHLYVATSDCTVSVVGTVFSVSSGSKGSRVAVIEGEVHVQQGSSSKSLLPGQQIATTAALGTTAIEDEISWSRDRDLHLAMLKEFVTFAQDLAQRIGGQPMRQTSDLLPLVPANTLLFFSLPNISQPFADSYLAMKQRIAENPTLQTWWNEKFTPSGNAIGVDEMIARVTRLGSYLGPEIIVAGNNRYPVLLADVAHQSELLAALSDDLSRVSDASNGRRAIQVVRTASDLAAASTNNAGLVIYVDDRFLIAAPRASHVQTVLAGNAGFPTTPLYDRIVEAYGNGVGWLVAADLSGFAHNADSVTGFGNAQQLVIRQQTGSGGTAYEATLGFNQARTGVAAWLAAPGPIGAAEFLSPNTYGAAAIVTKDPSLILDDFFGMLHKDRAGVSALQEFEAEHHIDLRYDIASRLGNEFLIAVDGPVLPTPAWKAVIEVNDAARIENAIQLAITEFNREAAGREIRSIHSSMEVAGGRTYYTLTSANAPSEIHYTFWAGYMIVAPTRSLLEEAIQYHDTGTSLARSDYFRAQFPADGREDASGFVYQNLGAMVSSIPVQSIKDAVGNTLPSLVCLYGETDRITLSSKGMIGANIANLAGLTGMMNAIGIQ
jgi:FecR protein/Putative zinc-finger